MDSRRNKGSPRFSRLSDHSMLLLESYQHSHRLFAANSFDKDELTVVWQTINIESACHYCVHAHTGIAKSMGVTAQIA